MYAISFFQAIFQINRIKLKFSDFPLLIKAIRNLIISFLLQQIDKKLYSIKCKILQFPFLSKISIPISVERSVGFGEAPEMASEEGHVLLDFQGPVDYRTLDDFQGYLKYAPLNLKNQSITSLILQERLHLHELLLSLVSPHHFLLFFSLF